jgi:hypothetical protein
VIIGGCGRSGTTLLSAMLDSHRNLCCGPESRLFPSPGVNVPKLARLFHLDCEEVDELVRHSDSKGQFIEAFAAAYCAHSGKPRWAEKTPGNIRVLDRIWGQFPNARVIHLLRDGRDVVCSLRTHPKYKLVEGKRVETGICRPLGRCARRWVHYVRCGLAHRRDPRYLEVRYEELVRETEKTLRRVFDFLDEPWDEGVLRYHERRLGSKDLLRATQGPGIDQPIYTSALGRWQREMSPRDLARFNRIAGGLMKELGYESRCGGGGEGL